MEGRELGVTRYYAANNTQDMNRAFIVSVAMEIIQKCEKKIQSVSIDGDGIFISFKP